MGVIEGVGLTLKLGEGVGVIVKLGVGLVTNCTIHGTEEVYWLTG